MPKPLKMIIHSDSVGIITDVAAGKPQPVTLWISESNISFELEQDKKYLIIDVKTAKHILKLLTAK